MISDAGLVSFRTGRHARPTPTGWIAGCTPELLQIVHVSIECATLCRTQYVIHPLIRTVAWLHSGAP